MTRYFAYGANMDPVHMAKRCPTAALVGRATLPGHCFRIAVEGYGTAAAEPGHTIHGVLWELEPTDETELDTYEGVPEGLYRKESSVVWGGDGQAVRAMLYRAADPTPGRPVPGYLERIIEVAETMEFPAEYVATLRRLLQSG